MLLSIGRSSACSSLKPAIVASTPVACCSASLPWIARTSGGAATSRVFDSPGVYYPASGAAPSSHFRVFAPAALQQQTRHGSTRTCSKSILNHFYCHLRIRRRWRRALWKGTMKWDDSIGQAKIPDLNIEGHEKHKNKPYKGKFENCRSQRVMFYH
ncbi:unnamed protein product [Amoebophrya sp. A120]|nr:unnamed protein product [Amoebophrya sp. A120]|eukprot:GSA120T00020964001.1